MNCGTLVVFSLCFGFLHHLNYIFESGGNTQWFSWLGVLLYYSDCVFPHVSMHNNKLPWSYLIYLLLKFINNIQSIFCFLVHWWIKSILAIRFIGFLPPKTSQIIWLSRFLTLGVPDEVYYTNVPCAQNYISMLVMCGGIAKFVYLCTLFL